VNKAIWTYWHQGFDQTPEIVKNCVRRAQEMNPEYEMYLLDRDSVYDHAEKVAIPDEKWERMSLAHRSDLLRTQLLIKYGGVWMDPTVFCMRPLKDWLCNYMQAGVFFFYRPGPDRILSNWFIAAEPQNFFLKKLYQALIDYWNEHDFVNLGKSTKKDQWLSRLVNGRSLELSQVWFHPIVRMVLKVHPYMIYHFMAYRLIKKDFECREIWNQMPKLSADGPHRLQRLGLLHPLTREGQDLIDNKTSPVFKLTWKLKSEDKKGSLLNYLLKHSA
jgi:hypothetical protein